MIELVLFFYNYLKYYISVFIIVKIKNKIIKKILNEHLVINILLKNIIDKDNMICIHI